MKRKPRMGRPPIPPAERRSATVLVHMTKAERKLLEAEAKKAGLSLSELFMLPWRKGD